MHFPSLVLAAAVSMRAAYADFLVLTEPPIPESMVPQFSRIADATEWTTSIFPAFSLNAWPQARSSLGSAYASNSSSAAAEIKSFFATASNYSVDAIITEAGRTATITSKPDWYDALPTKARQFKEQELGYQKSVLAEVINDPSQGAPATGSNSQGAAPTAYAGRGVEWALAAGAMAVFL